MALTQDRVDIIFPDGTEFQGKNNLRFSPGIQPQWVLDGALGNIFALSEDTVTNTDGSQKAQLYLGTGTGIHRFKVIFTVNEQSSLTWGGVGDDHPVVKLQTLDYELANQTVDSNSPITLKYGEYTDAAGAKHDPLKVVPGEVDLRFEGDDTSQSFTVDITFLEAVDSSQVVHGASFP